MKNTFSLLQYSISAAAVLSTAAVYSQVVYTDIDPDVVLDEPDEMFGIDLDDDGLNDFNFFNESFTTYIPYAGDAQVNAIFVGVFDTMLNGVAGSTLYFSAGPGYTYYTPFALQQGEIIGESIAFYNDNYQTMARTDVIIGLPSISSHQGNWNPYLWGYKLEDYIGFHFTDEESIQRYGWIRCSVIDSGRTLIIHDYAYELQPDQPILAGDTVSYVSINEQQNALEANVYSFNNAVYIHLHDYKKTLLHITDLMGKQIISEEFVNEYSTIDMRSFSTGIYLVTLTQNDKIFTKKLFIE
ncbi:MAG: T9SS type A sorting domain-containing protein [Chitinophagales bacterium]